MHAPECILPTRLHACLPFALHSIQYIAGLQAFDVQGAAHSAAGIQQIQACSSYSHRGLVVVIA
jgi:hypothetical protein